VLQKVGSAKQGRRLISRAAKKKRSTGLVQASCQFFQCAKAGGIESRHVSQPPDDDGRKGAPVGPPIWSLDPPRAKISPPATMAVQSPACGVTPEAMPNAIASGSATKPTVIPDRSRPRNPVSNRFGRNGLIPATKLRG
jgi:hypothetical protein